jgi:hypothetical protein
MREGVAPRGSRAGGPAQDYSTGQGFGPHQYYNANPGYPQVQDYGTGQQPQPGPGYAQVQDYGTGQQPQPGPGYQQAQRYDTGQDFGAAGDYNTGQQFQPGPGYPQAQGFVRGQGPARAPRSAQGAGYSRAGGYAPGQGPQRSGPQGARSNRRLYAVPDNSFGPQGMGPGAAQGTGGAQGMGPGGGQMVQYGGGQAVALAEPAWQDDPQEYPATMPVPAFAPQRPRPRSNGPASRQARQAGVARPASPAGPKTAPGRKPQGTRQGTRGRQYNAWRVAATASAVLFAITVLAAGSEIAHFGVKFFTFRASGVGETGGSSTDQSFLAQQAKAANGGTHTPGRHSAKTTSG